MHKGILNFFIMCLFLFQLSCIEDEKIVNSNTVVKSKIEQVLSAEWGDVVNKQNLLIKGYAIYVNSSKGLFYISVGELKNSTTLTKYIIGENINSFIASSILLLYQQKKLNLDSYITSLIPNSTEPYIPESREYNIPYKNNISIRKLLLHRSGVFDLLYENIPVTVNAPFAGKNYFNYVIDQLKEPDTVFNTDELFKIISKYKLYSFEPGVSFRHSNMGYALLAKISERVTGKTYYDFINENFLLPNGLIHTKCYSFIKQKSVEDTVLNIAKNTKINSVNNVLGGVITNIEDLTRWYTKLFRGKAGISENNVKYLIMNSLPTENPNLFYGLGCIYLPKLGYGNFGEYNGLWNLYMYNPEENVTFGIFAFTDNKNTNKDEMLTKLYSIAENAKKALSED
ncbi:MAG: serine hydrolase domain-containing protein [bacterium]